MSATVTRMERGTHGERLLARAEFKTARRRRLLLLTPGVAATLWALADLLAARHARLAGAGAAAVLWDHVQPVAWTLAAVVWPFSRALKPRPVRAGALAALLAGPWLSPAFFGPGGWHPWQIAVFALAAAGALAPANRG